MKFKHFLVLSSFLFVLIGMTPCNIKAQTIITPNSISGLQVWLSADFGVTYTPVTKKVTSWADQSGNNNQVFQNTNSLQPVFADSVVYNKPIIRFANTINYLSFTNPIDIQTVFFVYKYNGGNLALSYPILLGCSESPPKYISLIELGTADFRVTGETFFTTNDYYIDSVHTFHFNRLNSYNITAAVHNQNQLFTNIQIGASPIFANEFNSDIAEIIIYNRALTNSERKGIEQYLRYKYAPPVNLGSDINIAYGFCDTTLDAGAYFTHYIWNTGNPGDTLQTLLTNNGGFYSVTATDIFGFTSVDTILVNRPSLNLKDTNICQYTSAIINSYLNHDYTFQWSTTETDSFITVNNAGKYWLTVSDTLGCSITDTFYVSIDSFPSKASLGPDVAVCTGDSIRLVWGANQTFSYLWNDNTTNSYLIIDNPGTYSVTVTDTMGCIATDTIEITIKGPLPDPAFISDSVCLGETTHFTDFSFVPSPYSITEWYWNFGDGSNSNLQNPNHTYTTSGFHNATLRTVTNVGCSRSFTNQVIVYSIPVADLIPNNGCSNVPIQFQDNTHNQLGDITSWQWNFGDPGSGTNNTSILKDPIHTYSLAGNYTISLIATSEADCSDTINKSIVIRESANVDFLYTEACENEAIYFTDHTQTPVWNNIISWDWDFGDGNTSIISNPSHLYEASGTYQVTLTVKSLNGCEISIVKPVIVNAIPTPDFVLTDICATLPYQFIDNSNVLNGSIENWEWQILNLDTQYVQNPIFIFPIPGTYPLKLIVKTQAGCKDSITRNVTVFDSPDADFSFSPKYGIAPLTVNFTNNSNNGVSYLWNFGDASGTSLLKNPTYTFTQNGIYNIKLITYNQNDCYDSIVKQIKIIPSSLDIAVKDVKTVISNNYLSVSADLINLGIRTIDELYLYIESNQGNNIRETWKGILESGNQINYKFIAEIPLLENAIEYVCVRVSVPSITKDDNPANNEKCNALVDDFMLLDPYPNPTNGILNIAFILPMVDDVCINLYSSSGAKIKELYTGEGLKGYNIKTFDFSELAQGMYACQIKYRDKVKVVKFVKD